MKIDHYISKLLAVHDCVIIPGFGGLIGNYSPSRISSSHNTFYPPFKSILFNINLKQNDGLLANEVSKGENIPYEEAFIRISEIVLIWGRALMNGETVIIEKVGSLLRNTDGIICFDQDTEVNYLLASFGLTPVMSPAIHRARIQEKIEKRITSYLDAPESRRRIIPKPLKWAAVFLIPIGISTMIGVQHFESIKQFSSAYSGWYSSRLDPFKTSVQEPVKPLKAKPHLIHLAAVNVKAARVPVTAAVISNPIVTERKELPKSTDILTSSGQQPYAIIVGAFRLRENAVNLVDDLREKGFDASILDTTRTGLFRVRIQSFSDKDQAIRQLAVIRSKDFSGAWLLQK